MATLWALEMLINFGDDSVCVDIELAEMGFDSALSGTDVAKADAVNIPALKHNTGARAAQTSTIRMSFLFNSMSVCGCRVEVFIAITGCESIV